MVSPPGIATPRVMSVTGSRSCFAMAVVPAAAVPAACPRAATRMQLQLELDSFVLTRLLCRATDRLLRVTVSPAIDGRFNVNIKGSTHIGTFPVRARTPAWAALSRRPSAVIRRSVGFRGPRAAGSVCVGQRVHWAQRDR